MLQTLRNFPAYLNAGKDMSATQLLTKILRRTTGISTPALKRAELLNDPKLSSPDRITRLFDLLEGQAKDHAGWPKLEVAGRHVMEIGCGALGGFAPVALQRGCASYAGIEPMWHDEVFFHPAVEKSYLTPLAASLKIDIEGLNRDLNSKCHFERGTLEGWKLENKADLVISLSCLEHIGDLNQAAKTLKTLVKTESRQLHLVNFSNHRSKISPFDKMYAVEPDEYRAKYGNSINLLRPTDVLNCFQVAGFEARFCPVSVMPEALENVEISSYWNDRYSREELATRTGLLVID